MAKGFLFMFVFIRVLIAQESVDEKVKGFLEEHKYKWREENISEEDGKVLFNLIVENRYKSALEIGTSTGHSAIWIAWAMSKTQGKLITLEIDENRYREALANFEKAGLTRFIDARLGDAHELVYKLEGQFDFIFIDADKNWYKNYAIALLPKLKEGGCLTAHNVLNRFVGGIREFLGYIYSLPNLETKIDRSSRSGISISFKKFDSNKKIREAMFDSSLLLW